MDRRKSVMGFSEHWQDLLRFSLNNFALTVRGSDRPPACHSTLRTPQGEGFGGCALGGKADGVQGEKKGSTRAGASLYVIRWR